MFKSSCVYFRDEMRKWSLRLYSIEQLETNRVLRSLSAVQRRKAIRKMFSELTKNDLDVLSSRAVLYQQRVESGNPHPLDHEAMREIRQKEKLEAKAQMLDYKISVNNADNKLAISTNNLTNKENTDNTDNDNDDNNKNEVITLSSSLSTMSSSSSSSSSPDITPLEQIDGSNEKTTSESVTHTTRDKGKTEKLINSKRADSEMTKEMIKEVTPFEFFVKEQKSNPSMAAITSEEERVVKLKEIFDTLPDNAKEVIAKNAQEYAYKMARRRFAAAKARRESREVERNTSKKRKGRRGTTKIKSKKKNKTNSKAKNQKTKKKKNNSTEIDSNTNETTDKKIKEVNRDGEEQNESTSTTDSVNECKKEKSATRPPSTYTLFVKEHMLSVKHLPNKERLVEISRRWKALSDTERSSWKPQHHSVSVETEAQQEVTDVKTNEQIVDNHKGVIHNTLETSSQMIDESKNHVEQKAIDNVTVYSTNQSTNSIDHSSEVPSQKDSVPVNESIASTSSPSTISSTPESINATKETILSSEPSSNNSEKPENEHSY